jgi:hypothetical protein
MMLLIILLGATTNMALVSADCHIDTIGRTNQTLGLSAGTNVGTSARHLLSLT